MDGHICRWGTRPSCTPFIKLLMLGNNRHSSPTETGGGWFFDVQFCLAAPWWRYGVLLAAPWWPWAVSTTAPGWPWGSFVGCLMVASVGFCAAGPVGETDAPSTLVLYFTPDLIWGCSVHSPSWPNALACSTVVALAVGSMLPRPVAATSGLLDCFAWHPSLVEFHWVSPFSSTWGLMSGCWVCPGPWFASLPLLDYGASAPMVRFVPMAVVGCLRGGYSMVRRLVLPLALTLDLFTDCRILYRNVPSARPRERVLSCFPSDLTFTAEEQDAVLVAPGLGGYPAEDFAARLLAPRGRLALVADDHEATEVADPADPVLDPPGLASETSAQSDPAGPEVRADPNAEVRVNPSVAPTATAPAAPEGPAVPATAAPAVRKGQAVPATAAPMVRKGQAVPATAAPMADGEDLVNEAIPEAADSIIREVAAKILGADAPSDGSDPPIALAKMGPSPSASPPKSGLSKSAPAGLRRAAMPVVPEHQEFDEWCAARSRTPPANVAVHPFEARASSIPPPRPHKRQAPSSDPSRAKRSRASASSSSRIPSSTKAGMSSVNNSPAETARQSRREK
ncbi:hypothetical protein V6N11_080211 [Hibiscus sabdariffa]|uniref:Uncharacterized protein n=1 Tax=Hibiscus sabdariffa TaxID=183260 RepID=A0ABR1ZN59_9ROSI